MKNNKKLLIKCLIIAADALIILAGVFISSLANAVSGLFSPCPLKLLGYSCMGCGGTRCVYSFFKGNFAEAFGHNQFIFILIIYAIVLMVLVNMRYVFGLDFARKPIYYMTHPTTVVVIAVLFVIFGIVRNF